MENQIIGVQNTNDIQERINQFMARKKRDHSMIRSFLAGIASGFNALLIGLGAVAVLAIIYTLLAGILGGPDLVGAALSWLIHEGMEWSRGL